MTARLKPHLRDPFGVLCRCGERPRTLWPRTYGPVCGDCGQRVGTVCGVGQIDWSERAPGGITINGRKFVFRNPEAA